MCVEMYRQGKWPETPEGITKSSFHSTIRKWYRMEEACGPEALRHRGHRRTWTAEKKYELVSKVLAGASAKATAIAAGLDDRLLCRWVRCYKMKGYGGLATERDEWPPEEPQMRKKELTAELTPSEREEMLRLKAENEYLRAENAVIKKRIALRREKWAEELKAKKQKRSKNSAKKDIP